MFEHRRETSPLYRTGVFGGDAVLGLVTVTLVIAALIAPHYPWLAVGIVVIVAIACFARLICILAAVPINSSDFICRIDTEMIECICPDERDGESFQLRLYEIVKIERMPGDDSHGWYLYDLYGRRYWLTNHYDNPADTFAKLIENGNLSVDTSP